jgi:hypothetical protein
MDKRSKIALYAIAAVILLMMIAEVTKPKAINWRDSYSAADKIPLGCYVLFNELEAFSNPEIVTSTKSIYETLKDISDLTKTTLLLINNTINLDAQESNSLLKYVENGNTVFISSSYFYGNALDTLNVSMERGDTSFYKNPSYNRFTSPSLKQNDRRFEDVVENSYFISVDTLKTTVLGTMTIEDEDDEEEVVTHANFIKIPFGDNNGAFYLHTNPFAFTNYHLLNGNEDYAATVLSYLPKQQLIWDNYYKSGRKVITSPLRFILTNQALKWAFYLVVFSLILFVIFRGKRTQRIIPVITPLKNATVAFTQTIGDLYYQHGDFTNIIEKKIQYFLEYIRTKYYLNTNELSDQFISKLTLKSTNTKEDTKMLIDYIMYLKSKSQHTEHDLIQLNKHIEKFTKNTL